MKKLFALTVLAAGFALGQVAIGIRIGPPPPPRIERVRPAAPGAGFVFIEGYWYATGHNYRWHPGYWTRPPHEGALWVMPRHDGERFFDGHWEGPGGRFDHDHRWDRDRDRDFRRDRR